MDKTQMFQLEDAKRQLRKAVMLHKYAMTRAKNAYAKGLNDVGFHWRHEIAYNRSWEVNYWENQVNVLENPKPEKLYYTVKVMEDGWTIFLDEKCRKFPVIPITECIMKRRGKSMRGFIDAQSCTVFIFPYSSDDTDLLPITKLEVNYLWQEEKVREEISTVKLTQNR